MSLALMMMLQAASAAPDALNFDVRDVGRAEGFEVKHDTLTGCNTSDNRAIVVCGSRDQEERDRLRPIESQYETKHLDAETRLIGDLSGGLVVDSVTFPSGLVSNRLTVRLRKPF